MKQNNNGTCIAACPISVILFSDHDVGIAFVVQHHGTDRSSLPDWDFVFFQLAGDDSGFSGASRLQDGDGLGVADDGVHGVPPEKFCF